ncbi:hypothetical protein HKX48_002310, partial [Thoreauomyces humboldtii]
MQLLLELPVEIQELVKVKTGKVVKHYSTSSNADLQNAARRVMDKWRCLADTTKTDRADATSAPKKRKSEADVHLQAADFKNASSNKQQRRASLDETLIRKKGTVAPPGIARPYSKKAAPPVTLAKIKAKLATPSPPPPHPPKPSSSLLAATKAIPARSTATKIRVPNAAPSKCRPSSRCSTDSSSGTAEEVEELVAICPPLRGLPTLQSQPSCLAARVGSLLEDLREFEVPKTRVKKNWIQPCVISSDVRYTWGERSTEGPAQEERDRMSMKVTYFSDRQIPDSPIEPPYEGYSFVIPPKTIPWDVQ